MVVLYVCPELQNFVKYVEVVRENVTRGLTLSLMFTHIAEKEGLSVRSMSSHGFVVISGLAWCSVPSRRAFRYVPFPVMVLWLHPVWRCARCDSSAQPSLFWHSEYSREQMKHVAPFFFSSLIFLQSPQLSLLFSTPRIGGACISVRRSISVRACDAGEW